MALPSLLNFVDERYSPSDGYTNMARDVELLERAERGELGCRVYDWDGPWISLGKTQVAERDLLDPKLVPWVMRPTGGKAVLHGNDVTVGLAAPLDIFRRAASGPKDLSRSVRTVYRIVAQPLVNALNDCGLPCALAEDTPFAEKGRGGFSADCFAHISANDIVHRKLGSKVCGCALRLTSSAVLVQASIPKGPPLIDPQCLFAIPQTAHVANWNSEEFAWALERALLAL